MVEILEAWAAETRSRQVDLDIPKVFIRREEKLRERLRSSYRSAEEVSDSDDAAPPSGSRRVTRQAPTSLHREDTNRADETRAERPWQSIARAKTMSSSK